MTHHGIEAFPAGQVLVFAVMSAGSGPTDVLDAINAVKIKIQMYGRLFAFVRLSTFADGSFRAVAEFCNASAALTAVTSVANSPMAEVRDVSPQDG